MKEFFKKEIVRRYIFLLISQFFIGMGIAFTRHAGLGITPISSVPNVISFWQPQFSFGFYLAAWNIIMFLMQIVILRKDFKIIQCLQIPLSLIAGVFTDAGALVANRFPVDKYPYALMCIGIGSVILATGISISVICEVVLGPGEGIVNAIAFKTKFKFGNVKIAFDLSCVAVAVIMSMVFFDMKIVGVREGTVIAALLTGNFVKLITPLIKDDLTNMFKA